MPDYEAPEPDPMPGDPTYVSDEDLKALQEERATLYIDETEEQSTRRLFREAAMGAAASIIRMAQHSPNERIRLSAATYVVERVLGRVGDDAFNGATSPIDDLISEVSAYVNSQGKAE